MCFVDSCQARDKRAERFVGDGAEMKMSEKGWKLSLMAWKSKNTNSFCTSQLPLPGRNKTHGKNVNKMLANSNKMLSWKKLIYDHEFNYTK